MMPCPWCIQTLGPGEMNPKSSQVETTYDEEGARSVKLLVRWQCRDCGRYLTTWTHMMEGI